ncbi:MAG TPA: aldehyde ferredoxin oxidoreductase family protein [Desulfomonilia bacterium]
MPNGYMGRILWVDLSSGTFTEEAPPEEIYRKHLGGYGLGAYYIYSRMKAGCDPLGPDNILGFCPGLFTGTPAPFTGRYMVCGKSPLTGGWGDANSGGHFGPVIKQAGYDAIFFTGASDKPVYLLINNDKKELCDASDIWGKDVVEAEESLISKHGNGFKVAVIGKGGENKVLFSGIVCDRGRIAARSGLGAVMGSKNLKALCIRGSARRDYADRKKAVELSREYNQMLKFTMTNPVIGMMMAVADNFTFFMRLFRIGFDIAGKFQAFAPLLFRYFLHRWGTPFATVISHETGDTPIKNYAGDVKDFKKKISRKLNKNASLPYRTKAYGCFGCPVQCGAILTVPQLHYHEKETHRPEYETIAAFGGLILNSDFKVIMEINEYLNREGVDSISAGGVVAYTIECVEKGLLAKEDFRCRDFPEGFLPGWGKAETILPLLRLIVNREGIGDLLANGSKAASKIIAGSEEFAVTSGGQELPMHDARKMPGLMLTYAADPTPGRHTAGGVDFILMGSANRFAKGIKFKTGKDPEAKGEGQARAVKFKQAFNSLGFCEFSVWCGMYPLWEMFSAITGWDITPEELLETGWRIQTLRQLFNDREGALKIDVNMRALGIPPRKDGVHKNVTIDIIPFIKAYYRHIGFDEDGKPDKRTIEKLGLI